MRLGKERTFRHASRPVFDGTRNVCAALMNALIEPYTIMTDAMRVSRRRSRFRWKKFSNRFFLRHLKWSTENPPCFFPFSSRYVTTSEGLPEKKNRRIGRGLTLTPTASGTSQTLASLTIPQELFEALPFSQRNRPRVVLLDFVLIGHPLIDLIYLRTQQIKRLK